VFDPAWQRPKRVAQVLAPCSHRRRRRTIIGLIKKPALWKLAATWGPNFSAFLQGFRAMRAGYKSKVLVYGVLVGQKK
jgi:hypothetical protein